MTIAERKEKFRSCSVYRAKEKIDGWIRDHKWTVLLFCCFVMALTTFLKYRVYEPSGFRDASNITNLITNGAAMVSDTATGYTFIIFRGIDALTGHMTLVGWSWFLLIPGMAIFVLIASKSHPKSLEAVLILIGFSVLLPFYVFMPGVDMIQYLVFALMALILLTVPTQIGKLAASLAVLVPVGLFFREYYFLMVIFAVILFVVALLYRRQKTASQQAIFLMGLAILAILMIFLARIIWPDEIDTLFTVRTMTNQGIGSAPAPNKVILDFLPMERSVPGFLANYIVAGIRLMCPLELCADITDVPFVIFQILLGVLLIVELRRSRRVKGRTAVYSLTIAFFLMSFFFEPDFGSWFRHEAAAFPLLWLGIGHDIGGEKI